MKLIHMVICMASLGAFLLVPAGASIAGDFRAQLAAAMSDSPMKVPSQAEVRKAEKLFIALMQGQNNAEVRQGWMMLGFSFCEDATYYYLQPGDRQPGAGWYVIRKDGGIGALIVPHGITDLDTDTIGVDLFEAGHFACGAWNTVRRRGKNGTSQDLADMHISFFNAFTTAFARVHPAQPIIQIHGFARNKRKTEEGRAADIIISSGTKQPSQEVKRGARCLKEWLPETVALYPVDVKELGARTNVQGQVLRSMGSNAFIHVEISRALRKRFIQDRSLIKALAACLVGRQ